MELQLSISPFNEYSGLISFRTDWFDLAVQGTFRSLLQHHSLKASILQCVIFLTIQLSQPYVTTGKTTALTIWTFVSRVTEKAMAPHSSTLAWKIPWMEEPGRSSWGR